MVAALRQLVALPLLHYRAADGGEAPRSLAELAALRGSRPPAGGRRHRRGPVGDRKAVRWTAVQLGAVTELKQIAGWTALEIGAAAPGDAFAALSQWTPHWAELARRFCLHPGRHAGTLGGNIANGSPIGDSMPALIALGATLRLQRGDVCRPSWHGRFLSWPTSAPALTRRVCPRRAPGRAELPAAYKVAKRHDQDISAVAAGVRCTNAAGHVTTRAMAYAGGMAATPPPRHRGGPLPGAVERHSPVEAAIMPRWKGDFQPQRRPRRLRLPPPCRRRKLLMALLAGQPGRRPHRAGCLADAQSGGC